MLGQAYRSQLSRRERRRDSGTLMAPAVASLVDQRVLERVVDEVHGLQRLP